jgi:hypothetical protein
MPSPTLGLGAVGAYPRKIGFKSQGLIARLPAAGVLFSCIATFGLVFSAGSLLGCAGSPIAVQREAQARYANSARNYRIRLTENSSSVKACEGLPLAMEANERAFNNMSASLPADFSGTRSVKVQ